MVNAFAWEDGGVGEGRIATSGVGVTAGACEVRQAGIAMSNGMRKYGRDERFMVSCLCSFESFGNYTHAFPLTLA
jgi:hypothetical protein